jgi:predicted dienelactone hydrolase
MNSFSSSLLNLMFGGSLWLLSLVSWLMRSPPVLAAEKVSFWYGALEFSIPVDSLETYAKTGEIDNSLAVYDQYFSPQKLAKLGSYLVRPIDLDPVTISRCLNTSLGENILKSLGQIIKPSVEQNGFYALRSALISAAGSPNKLTLLNILRQFPAETVQVDAKSILKLANTFVELKQDTNQAIANVAKQATQQAVREETSKPGINFAQLPDLTKSGTLAFQKQTLALVNQQSVREGFPAGNHEAWKESNRTLDVDFYRPILEKAEKTVSVPVIIISPGFGADKSNFSYLGEHLASYGFAVAILNHPGSDRQNLQNFLAGTTKELVEAEELINRPQDISYLLDELQRQEHRNPSPLGTLNLEQVGVIGHSLGAYAGLTLAGAKPNIEDLQQHCPGDRVQINFDWFNPSQQLQCLASQLSTHKNYQLSDKRIKAVFAINPIGSNIFGEAELNKLQIPVAFVAGSSDLIAPPLLEQIEPFSWLGSRDKYLLLINQGTHTYGSFETFGKLASFATDESFNPQLAREYFQAMSLAFMETHLVNSPQYRSFLSNDYAKYISHKSMQLDLINSRSKADLN